MKSRMIPLLWISLFILPPFRSLESRPTDGRSDPATPKSSRLPLDAIIVSAENDWLIPLAAPLASRLQVKRETPPLFLVASAGDELATEFLSRLKPERCLLLTSEEDLSAELRLDPSVVEVVQVGSDPLQAGILLAQRFWDATEEVVAAAIEEPREAILGATLAAHRGIPFIPLRGNSTANSTATSTGDRLAEGLRLMGVKSLLAAVKDISNHPPWTEEWSSEVTLLDGPAMGDQVIHTCGPASLRSILLARTPITSESVGGSSWLAPYISLARKAPVILCNTADGQAAEEEAQKFICRHALKQRSVMILGDHRSIGTIKFKDPELLENFEVDIEPCSGTGKDGASALAVGRIPFNELPEAALLVARGLARERLLDQDQPQALVIANPKTEYELLPLCETISRATAEELKNFRIPTMEFYGLPADDPGIFLAASKATLLIYEGHITDQLLFPCPQEDPSYEGYDPEIPWEDDPESYNYERYRVAFSDQLKPAGESPWKKIPPRPKLESLPLTVIQSCHSLSPELCKEIYLAGSLGFVGTTTNIHSASGSSFVKTFLHGILYRADTVGEALRDARNFFFCLAQLKSKRGHTQQAKAYRVALSFCLWGDPEVRLIHPEFTRPKRKPAMASFTSTDRLALTFPSHRLPEVSTPKYVARLVPGAEVAGIVMRIKDKTYRRLAPIYFFRLMLPAGFEDEEFTGLQRADGEETRTAYLVDSFQRFCYVIYFPEKEMRQEDTELLFKKR